ncbi:MAG: nicotinate-nucleotide--dimethylbenzimidazole phosphoribosyltransferase [Gammaproteobacteria bacterium]|nr:nicotinate-nucleotide--dimethylbenzimidazole phosphoribosyltransferase [Gammaproteobacteria bacterium]
MQDKDWFTHSIPPPDQQSGEAALERQATLTKPAGSLGRIEALAVHLAAMQSALRPQSKPLGIAVFAGDHGVAKEGISAFPPEVTAQMVLNFLGGGAAISVLAKRAKAQLCIVNAGTTRQDGYPEPVIDRPVGYGTRNFLEESAMTMQETLAALVLGRSVMDEYLTQCQIVVGGEMGIGNTACASALAAALGVAAVSDLVGPGTGLDEQGVFHKQSVIEKSLARIGDQPDPLRILTELGGYEVAALAGFYIRAAMLGITIIIDGFISSVAALVACKLNPDTRAWMLFSHTSQEPGHACVLQALQADPLLSLGMRLGEGSGAAIAYDLVDAACELHNKMATFDEAGVSDRD